MQLILVGGAQRSGTTLLQTLLVNALQSPNLPEAHILSDILAAYKRAKEFGNKTGYFYATDDDLRAFFQSFAERHIADIVARAKPFAALVLKDPNFIQVLDEAASLFPSSVRIVCMRDPRDIAASFVQIGQRQQPAASKPGKYERRDINFISKKILASYQPLLHGAARNAVMVRYEAIASDPKGSLEALARDAGLKMHLDCIEQPVWLDAEARHEASWITELEGAEASPASIGSFKRVLTSEEVAMVQEICEPIMSRFGYAPVETPRRRGRFFGLGLLRPGKR
jgi:Sulfotransferase family